MRGTLEAWGEWGSVVAWGERTKFEEIRTKLRALLEHQITHFRYVNIIVGSHNITMPEFQALKQLCSDMVSITTTYQ